MVMHSPVAEIWGAKNLLVRGQQGPSIWEYTVLFNLPQLFGLH